MSEAPLDILHVLRAPVGGLFRHVLDLAAGQSAAGHRVGLFADATTGGERAEAKLAEIASQLAHGVLRLPVQRTPGLGDAMVARRIAAHARAKGFGIIHGHGAKGGLYARLLPRRAGLRVYTPHGGSLHYEWSRPAGFAYLAAERALALRTDLALFESAYGRSTYARKIGRAGGIERVVHNGVGPEEFVPVPIAADAADIVFLGELRMLKGIDVLIEAIARINAAGGRQVRAECFGDGPDRDALLALAAQKGLGDAIAFPGARPAREAFGRGRILVVPSRAESLPYVVLEAAAAGVPVIATRVGGIGEIFGEDAGALVPPDDAEALGAAILEALDVPVGALSRAVRLKARVAAEFTTERMVAGVEAAYRAALAARGVTS